MANMAGAHLEHSQVAISHPFTVSLRHEVVGLHAMFTFSPALSPTGTAPCQWVCEVPAISISHITIASAIMVPNSIRCASEGFLFAKPAVS
jgi:hypothetical protein